MADPEISQTNFIPLHQPQPDIDFTSSSSYDPENSTGNSSFEVSSGDDENSSLSGLEEACSTLQINTNSGSSTESLDDLELLHHPHHNQTLAESTDASTNTTTTPTTQPNSRALIDMRPLNAIILHDHLASASDTDSLMVAMCDHELLPAFVVQSASNSKIVLIQSAVRGWLVRLRSVLHMQALMKPTLSPQKQAQFSPQKQIQKLAQLSPQKQAQFSPPCLPCPASHDAAPRSYPPSDNGGWIRAPTASNGTQPHAMAPLPIPDRDSISQAYSMVAVCDTALRFQPPPDIDGLILAPAAFNGTQSHTMATLPARTIKKFVQNYEDMPAAIRAFTRWLLSHEGRRFYIMNPIMANYIEGITKYDRLSAIDHHQHDLTRRLCSTSMFSLTICMASSEHQHWIHASNSLCGFLASEYAFTAPPDSSIIDTDAIAFRTMNHQLDIERVEIIIKLTMTQLRR